jgi:hypothetical protein
MNFGVRKIISGGQTGADRAALDFALENQRGKNFETGGWIPARRQAEDGRISEKYSNLRETASEFPEQRTEFNVSDSDATLILSHGSLAGGSKFTLEMCQKYRKPFLHIDLEESDITKAIAKTQNWLASIKCEILNVAGSRASEDALIYEKSRDFLTRLFS